MDTKTKEIIETIQKISGRQSPQQVFSDWVEMMAISIANTSRLFKDEVWQKRERRYLDTAAKYTGKELLELAKMTGLLTETLEEFPEDILGYVYMALESGSKRAGQFFTPFHISELMAKMSLKKVEEKERLLMMEPSCGGGGMIIATAKALMERGINYQKIMDVTAQDLDTRCIHMCYVQLSLLGIKAAVIQGDALAKETTINYKSENTWNTPRKAGMIF